MALDKPLFPLSAQITFIPGLLVVLVLVLAYRCRRRRCTIPGPCSLPVIGSLHLLGGHQSPFQAFTELSYKYGPMFSLDLGVTKCVVVSSFPLIKDVLIAKGSDFGGRPDFIRFHKLFGGDRNNCSL